MLIKSGSWQLCLEGAFSRLSRGLYFKVRNALAGGLGIQTRFVSSSSSRRAWTAFLPQPQSQGRNQSTWCAATDPNPSPHPLRMQESQIPQFPLVVSPKSLCRLVTWPRSLKHCSTSLRPPKRQAHPTQILLAPGRQDQGWSSRKPWEVTGTF